MFKFFAIVFAAILAVAVADPKPGFVASPVVASRLAYSAPVAYSAPWSYASGYSPYVASPLAYSAYGAYGSYAYPAGYVRY